MILFMVDTPAYINPEEIAFITIGAGRELNSEMLLVETAWWTEVALKSTEKVRIGEIFYEYDEAEKDFIRIMGMISDATPFKQEADLTIVNLNF